MFAAGRTFEPVKIVDIELSRPLRTLEGLDGYRAVKALVRLHGTPLGWVDLPLLDGRCAGTSLSTAIVERHGWAIVRHLLLDALAHPGASRRIPDLFAVPHPTADGPSPRVTVAICTRDRPADLAIALRAVSALEYPDLDVLVVDNSPTSDAVRRLVATEFAGVRYVQEPRPGLDWARNRAIAEARGEIIAFTDDDVVVDSGWVRALVGPFAEDRRVMAVTGLVVPYELETEAQVAFEDHNGFGRGFARKVFRLDPRQRSRWLASGTGQCGTGANMAYRRALFAEIGGFDPALDVGTVTHGGGDIEMFYRTLKAGHLLVYEPSALVRHRHRRDDATFWTQIRNNGIGFSSYCVRSALAYPEERLAFLRFWLWWVWLWHLRHLVRFFVRPSRRSPGLILTELAGAFRGLVRYPRARRIAAALAGDAPLPATHPVAATAPSAPGRGGTAVRLLDLGRLEALADVADRDVVRAVVTSSDRTFGTVDIATHHQPIGVSRLSEAVVDAFGLQLLEPATAIGTDAIWGEVREAMKRHFAALDAEPLPATAPVSVVVTTCDRPDDLRACLESLRAQASSRPVEIVVVDNNPASGLTPPVVREFPEATLVNEPRRGTVRARRTGFDASRGDIVVALNDDLVAPAGWLEKVVAPFERTDVMLVLGNVVPVALDTAEQWFYERYGGVTRGFAPFELGASWFESSRRALPTWKLGPAINAAFRTRIFQDPSLTALSDGLVPGASTGSGEDRYLFYKVLEAGYTVVYEPSAWVWHRHRGNRRAMRRQVFADAAGCAAYQLTTLLRERDPRALGFLVYDFPRAKLRAAIRRVLRRSDYPLGLTLAEVGGHLLAPWWLWRSHRVRRRSTTGAAFGSAPQERRMLAGQQS